MTARTVLTSPVSGEEIGEVREWRPEAVASAVAALGARYRDARARAELARSRLARCDRLDAAADLLEERIEALAADLVTEHGKPLGDARAEVADAADQLRLTASYARAFSNGVPVLADTSKRVLFSEEPIGVVAAITPWNFPFYIPIEYIGPALAMGNAVAWKPAETTPRSNQNLLKALLDAGFGDADLARIDGGPATGAALVRCDGLAALCFTGSSEVGREIQAAAGGRPALLELGGNGPTAVLADADVERAARSIASAAFWASGQSCGAAERILVHERRADELAEAIRAEAGAYLVGDPTDERTTVGPLHLEQTARTMERHVADALDRGARLLTGGAARERFPTARYWEPTVLADVDPGSDVFLEETFGPIAPLTTFATEDQLAGLAARGGWGLVASVFTSDLDAAHRVADALPAGLVVVNDHSNYWEAQLPVGGGPGTKSGVGRLGLDNVLRFMSTTKALAFSVR